MSDELKGKLRLLPERTLLAVFEESLSRIEELEAKLGRAVYALEKLARLGNGEDYGNSDGNMIARAALEGLEGQDRHAQP